MIGRLGGSITQSLIRSITQPYYSSSKYSNASIRSRYTPSNPFTLLPSWILYYWGPALRPNDDANVEILAAYNSIDQPVAVASEYGIGRIFLIGTPPEIEEDSDRDGTSFAEELDDERSDWELMKQAARWCLGES